MSSAKGSRFFDAADRLPKGFNAVLAKAEPTLQAEFEAAQKDLNKAKRSRNQERIEEARAERARVCAKIDSTWQRQGAPRKADQASLESGTAPACAAAEDGGASFSAEDTAAKQADAEEGLGSRRASLNPEELAATSSSLNASFASLSGLHSRSASAENAAAGYLAALPSDDRGTTNSPQPPEGDKAGGKPSPRLAGLPAGADSQVGGSPSPRRIEQGDESEGDKAGGAALVPSEPAKACEGGAAATALVERHAASWVPHLPDLVAMILTMRASIFDACARSKLANGATLTMLKAETALSKTRVKAFEVAHSTKEKAAMVVDSAMSTRVGVTLTAAAAGTVGGSVTGGTVGVLGGAAVGVVPALFTFGLSIPVCAAIGLCAGATAGGAAGGIGGGAVGYGGFTYREEIRGKAQLLHDRVRTMVS